jgi:ABC-2 type transport system ATP-binding protein
MQVRRYLSFRAALAGVTGAAARDAIDREMARCDLTTVATKRISALSKGFRQRVGLAAALVHDPKVVILDEPSNGLDPSQILQFRSLIATLARERTMLISSHILSEVQKICSRVIIIAGGTLRADSTPDAIARRARGIRTFTVAFDINDYAAARDLLRAIPDVRDVTPISHPAESRFEVTSDALDLRHRIARAAHDRNLLVIELAETAPSLEQAFMQLVTQEARA